MYREPHAIEDGGVEHCGHGGGIQRLLAIGPHVRTVSQIVLSRLNGRSGLVILQDVICPEQIQLAHSLSNPIRPNIPRK